MTLRRIKLFDKLNMEYSNDHAKDKCCDAPLSDKEVDLLDEIPVDELTETAVNIILHQWIRCSKT